MISVYQISVFRYESLIHFFQGMMKTTEADIPKTENRYVVN